MSVTRLGRWGPIVHLVLAGLAFGSLLIAPVRIADLRIQEITPVVDLLRILGVIVLLPAFVLTTTTPLVSGWFATARSGDKGDPYWLYALSNGGSLLALLAYPTIIEPRLGLTAQRGLWTIGYAVLVVMLGVAATRVVPALRARPDRHPAALPLEPGSSTARRRRPEVAVTPPRRAVATPDIDWPRRLRWLLLAADPVRASCRR